MAVIAHPYKDKTIAVMGLGKAGLSAVRALCDAGAAVRAWDDNDKRRDEAATLGAQIIELTNSSAFDGCCALVLSPGIPHTHPEPHPAAAAAKAAGVPIIGEVALLAETQPDARYIGITGTNGKSTTTALTGHILEHARKKVGIGGNLGTPSLDLDALGEDGTYVLEMSSYQLELSPIHFHGAVLLNISPDHLARHGGMDGYVAAKMRIFDGQTADDFAVVAIDDDRCAGLAEALTHGDRRVVPVSSQSEVPGGVYVKGTDLIDDLDGEAKAVLDLSMVTTLPGLHNWQNVAAAYATVRLLGISEKVTCDAISDYPGLPHRQQMIAIIDDVAYVNDSKATNAEAAAKALSCYGDIYWIAGGVEKEGGYTELDPYLSHIRHAFLIGEGAGSIADYLGDRVPHTLSVTLDTAVAQASTLAREDGAHRPVVLLSPACASFDQYQSFEARGDHFLSLVRDLPGQIRQFFVMEGR
ncbi:UDP-N-acetylmuramoyl-L-alanine--D-glutamate ligase [Aestuariispira ectoiniformans]|uniref:UDP-N-acetylmuramoyl-L-alanine--D-glutamate ligase n=1 Tax=Aestuariispira ectoiniformans TaxID=2775080 RepID=UPI00223BFA89|nr:UDP-N-acetylmuramoyl-L-alanine--D-glutamate ligase [Aestuariispira ectoiniformans]